MPEGFIERHYTFENGQPVALTPEQEVLFHQYREFTSNDDAIAMALAQPANDTADSYLLDVARDVRRILDNQIVGVDVGDLTERKKLKRAAKNYTIPVYTSFAEGQIILTDRLTQLRYKVTIERVES